MEYLEYLNFAKDVATQVGELVHAAFYSPKHVEYKSSHVDLVTETDKKVETIIIDTIRTRYPDHVFMGEEGVAANELSETLTDSPTWIIDPIDGTTNFVHRYPWVAISIALSINKQTVIGIVYNPILKEMFCATRGGGAFLNGNQIHASQAQDLKESLIMIGFPYDRSEENLERHLKRLHILLKHCREMRRDGSAALDMCNIALGRGELYFEYGIHAWDIAAGGLIAEEAGAVLADPDNGPNFDICGRKVVVGNPTLVKKFLELLHPK